MKTSQPVSTISYNSDKHLRACLDGLVDSGKADFWFYVSHLPDSDDDKPHKHVYIILNHFLDTNILKPAFNSELDPLSDEGKHLGITWFNISKHFSDAYLYFIHDDGYLMSKHLQRKHHYKFENCVSSDLSSLWRMVSEIDYSEFDPFSEIANAVQNNIPFGKLIKMGVIKKRSVGEMRLVYEELYNYKKWHLLQEQNETLIENVEWQEMPNT